MKPWDIIGWMILGVIGLVVLALLALVVMWIIGESARMVLHLRTRNTPPAEGQVWNQGGDRLHIRRVTETGGVWVDCGSTSWGDSSEGWKLRVRSRKLFLEKSP